jgi:ABC-type multidrug transport system ATPase subunit
MAKSQFQQLYLTKIQLKGYKSINDCGFELKKGLNIIIGKNGAGKSNLFEFIENVVSGYPKEVNFKEAEFELVAEDGNRFKLVYEKNILDNEFVKSNPDSRFQINRKLVINDEKKAEGLLDGVVIDPIKFKNKLFQLKLSLDYFFFDIKYNFPYSLNLKYSIPENLSFLDKSGKILVSKQDNFWRFPNTLNFVKYLFLHIESDLDSLDNVDLHFFVGFFKSRNKINNRILENLKFYSPIQNLRFHNNILIDESPENWIIDNLLFEFYVNDSWLPWSQLSDGTKRLFYLITEITTKETGLILIEEPELGVHPHQFSLLMDFIKQESETKQILISTHSPKALDHLNKDELRNILIASYDKKKGTQVRNLSKEEESKASKYMSEVAFLSDYWLSSNLEE